MALDIILFLIMCGIIFAIAFFGMNFIRTNQFRETAQSSAHCKFYMGEEKQIARILNRTGDQVELEYYDEDTSLIRRNYHISDIYPIW